MTFPSVNVASHLARLAVTEPDRPAIHFPAGNATVTFAQLHADSDAIAHGLTAATIVRGTRVALMVPPSIDFFALTFALFKVAAVPVMIDPGMGVRNLGKCLAEAEPEAFIGIPKAHLARRILRWGRKTIRTTVNVGWGRFFCHHSVRTLRDIGLSLGAYPMPDVAADETAAILFTSGSTGVAKGAVYTHGIFAAQVEMLKATYGIEPGEVDLCTFPLFALFGPALGMTCVIPDMNPSRPASIDPHKAVEQVKRYGVTNLFGSPAVIRRLAELSDAGLSLPTVRRVISAGAPARAADIERFTQLLPATTEVFTPYGATEALPVANIGSREILTETRHLTDRGKGVCIGRPVAGMTVHVVRITDEAIPEWDDSLLVPQGEVGEFVVRGPVVTKQYHNRPEATRLAKIRDSRTGETLHRMGDVGYLDDRGRLWFCGRKSHRVVTPWGTLFTDMVEGQLNRSKHVRCTALVGVIRGGETYPVICYEVETGGTSRKGLILRPIWRRQALESLHKRAKMSPLTERIVTFLRYPGSFPVDVRHNSKIFREKLAVWADKQLGPKWKGGPR